MRWEQVDELRADPGRAPGDPEAAARMRRRSVLPAIAVVSAAAAFGGVIWFAYHEGRDAGSSGSPPVVKAEEGPTKVKPDQPGGMDVPFQNSTVYDRLGQAGQKPVAEKLLPPPEAPAERPQPAPAPIAQAAATQPAIAQPGPSQPAAVTAAPPGDTRSPTALAPQPMAGLAITQPAVTPPSGAATTALPHAAVAQVAGGTYRIQIGSVKTAAAVETEWARLKHRFPDILGSLAVTSGKAELPGKGVFYRVQAGPLDPAGAKSACERLRAQSLGCIVVKS